MRLTDTCIIRKSGTVVGSMARRCEFGHTGGETPDLEPGRRFYRERARVIVGPDAELTIITNVSGWTVEHKGKTYNVESVLPRYRPGGRLHHVSLDLEAFTG